MGSKAQHYQSLRSCPGAFDIPNHEEHTPLIFTVRVEPRGADLSALTARHALVALLKMRSIQKVKREQVYSLVLSQAGKQHQKDIETMVLQSPFFFNPVKEKASLSSRPLRLPLSAQEMLLLVRHRNDKFPYMHLIQSWIGHPSWIQKISRGVLWTIKTSKPALKAQIQQIQLFFHHPLFQRLDFFTGGSNETKME